MMPVLAISLLAGGMVLLSRFDCIASRPMGAALLAVGSLLLAAPAYADETITATDNGEVRCTVSAKDLTRISLQDDQFAAVSKVETGNPQEDFSVVHEPTRGDIYLSIPDGYARDTVSFFGTTRKGFVYKFACRLGGAQANQVFIANRAVTDRQSPAMAMSSDVSLDEHAVGLVRAMFEARQVAGYRIEDAPRAPVNVGALKVQLVTEYLSPTLTGKVLRVQNTGGEAITLDEALIAGSGAVAVSIANPSLQPGQATAAYVVVPAEEFTQ